VTVLGIGAVSVFGTSNEAFRDALLEGRTGVAPVAGFDTAGCRTILAAEITGFAPTSWVAPMKLRRLDRTGVYAIAATRLALDDAGVTVDPEGEASAGVVLGTWTAGGQSTQIFLDALFRQGPAAAPALLFDSTVANSAASLAGLEFKLRGPNMTETHKEASGLAAIVTAVDLLREGRASALMAGGVDAVYETFFKGHDRFAVMSAEPAFSRRLSPFDSARRGFVIGEGGFGVWLDASDEHRGEGHGEILGVSASSAAIPVNAWPAQPEPLVRTMRQAIDDAGLDPGDIDVVYASANATGALDAVEAVALRTLFIDAAPVVTSIKGALGEFGAVGGAACAAAFLCGGVGEVPPIAGLTDADPIAQPLRLARERTAAPGPIVLVNSFASGGALFSAVLRVADVRVASTASAA
jgi:3-oxoacyl-[acyl-carrier-protein] synthase II